MNPFSLFDAPCSPDQLLTQENSPPQALLTRNGVSMLGRYKGRQFIVERLLSTAPSDYLHIVPGDPIPCPPPE